MPTIADLISDRERDLLALKRERDATRERSKAADAEDPSGLSMAERLALKERCSALRLDGADQDRRKTELGKELESLRYEAARDDVMSELQNTEAPADGTCPGGIDPLTWELVKVRDRDGRLSIDAERLTTDVLSGRGTKPPAGSPYAAKVETK